GVRILSNIIESGQFRKRLPEMYRIFKELPGLDMFAELEDHERLTVRIISFSYMNGMPQDKVHGGGFIYDCRGLPNPAKIEELRNQDGLDDAVRKYMSEQDEVKEFMDDVVRMVLRSVKSYIVKDYNSLAVSFGCTEGRHRSVYCAEKLAGTLKKIEGIEIKVNHRDKDN
ncbi:MAG: RapZ C-terminal domain-containing protein, partial [Bacteroidota bacterium]